LHARHLSRLSRQNDLLDLPPLLPESLPFDPKRCFRWAEEHRLRRVQKVAASERSTVSSSVIAAITAKGVEPPGNQRARTRRISDSHQNAGN